MLDPVREEMLRQLLTMPFGQLVSALAIAKAEAEEPAIIKCLQAAIKHRCYQTLKECCGIDYNSNDIKDRADE